MMSISPVYQDPSPTRQRGGGGVGAKLAEVMAPETLPKDDRRGFTAEDAERMRRKYVAPKAAEPKKPNES
jgi:hypothetical protein